MGELEKLCRLAFGAYEFLRDHDLSAESGTSKRLRNGDLDKLRARLAEELAELRGVIEGTHYHEGFDRDIILEGYEVWYWAVNWTIAQEISYGEVQPHFSLEVGYNHPPLPREELLDLGQKLIEQAQTAFNHKESTITLVSDTMRFVGLACTLNRTSPAILVERDIREMKEKPYLVDYWHLL